MIRPQIITQVAAYVTTLFKTGLSTALKFHTLNHTLEVVKATKLISKHYAISAIESEIVELAAWFHDTGFISSYHNHEAHSATIARDFLEPFAYDAQRIVKVINCISATKIPQKPKNLLECIICDADMFHLSGDNYWTKNQLLKEEITLYHNIKIRMDQWYYENLSFLRHHQYHTRYGRKILAPKKAVHLEQNIQKLKEISNEA